MKQILTITLLFISLHGVSISYASDEGSGVFVQNPSPSPTGTEIVFGANFDGSTNLWITGIDGKNLRKLTANSNTDDEPSWSPNGKTIVFTSIRTGVTNIGAIYPDGSHLVQLTSKALNNKQPTWSPDGKKIAFISDRGGTNDIWIMNADGSSQTRLTNLPGEEDHPSFSPFGDQLVFSEAKNGPSTLMIVNIDGTNPLPLTTGNNNNDWNPQWSINGIIFSSNRDTTSGQKIWIIQPDGEGLKKLSDTSTIDPVPLPDGRVIFSDGFSNQLSNTALSALTLLDPISGTKNVLTSVANFLPKGDVNNDGLIDCSDMSAFKTILGKKLGQSGFNPRADTNNDSVINIKDLSFVSQRLPKGTICK